jgi:hypothetical protein
MHDLLAHINRRAKGIERNLHNVDCPDNAGTEAPRLEEKNPLGFRFVAAPVSRDAVKSGGSHVSQYTAFNPSLAICFEPKLVQQVQSKNTAAIAKLVELPRLWRIA